MRESTIVRQIIAAVKRDYPTAWVRKLADRYTRGLPDLLICWAGYTLFVEVKRPGGKLATIQALNRQQVIENGNAWIVVESALPVMAWMGGVVRRKRIAKEV